MLNTPVSQPRAIGTIGTIGRVILGLFLILVPIWGPAWWGGEGLHWHEPAIGLILFPAVVLLFQWIRLQVTT